jgi:hypothetical protein
MSVAAARFYRLNSRSTFFFIIVDDMYFGPFRGEKLDCSTTDACSAPGY